MPVKIGATILLILPVLGAGQAYGDNSASHAQCVVDYSLGNYLQALSSCSNANAQSTSHDRQVANYLLGEIYAYGKGVEKDQNKALQFYIESAAEGYPPAQLVVGHYYSESGNANAKESLIWYLRAGSAEWDGAAYALSRAADLLIVMGRQFDAYKCLYAAEQMAYSADSDVIGLSMSAEDKQRAQRDVHSWLKNRNSGPLIPSCDAAR